MHKAELIQQLVEVHRKFIDAAAKLDAEEFLYAPPGKWTAGQQVDHIRRSVSPVRLAFSLPTFIPRLLFGKANRPSITYEQLVEKYKRKLSEGGRAFGRFVPAEVQFGERGKLLNVLKQHVRSLANKISMISEEKLDRLILPHPLLGKITLREMVFFTAYHAQHHHRQLEENLREFPRP